ncbi:MAG: DUF4032 domain-containing protein [Elusimicrobiota bacterium]|jgi:hypothetical protein|nr:DUF4032 domain-containing protein [Elusimicrobiota bacterium]
MSVEKNVISADFSSIEKNLGRYKVVCVGVKPIEISKIAGSLGRYSDFSEKFLPRKSYIGIRYASIRESMKNGETFPPISVYQILDNYFVIDGHHRIMAAREVLDAAYIDADIKEIKFDFDISPDKVYSYNTESARKFLIKLEEYSFQKKTSISNSILKYPIKVTELVSFGKLYREIENYHKNYNKGEFLKRHIIFAALHWYECHFMPSIITIKKEKILQKFKDRTYTDLYVWMQQHKYYLSQKAGYDVGFDYTIKDFCEKYSNVKSLYIVPNMISSIIKEIKHRLMD